MTRTAMPEKPQPALEPVEEAVDHVRGSPGGRVLVDFLVDDVDAEYPRVAGLGVEFVLPPTTQPWGNRSMIFRDPAGNLINVFSRSRAGSARAATAWPRKLRKSTGSRSPTRVTAWPLVPDDLAVLEYLAARGLA